MIWIYIDTNVFLDFYQAGTDRIEIFKELLARADCILVPEQTVREFRRNRSARLAHLADQVEKSADVNVHTTAIIRELPDFSKWVEAKDAVKGFARRIAMQLRKWAQDESSDPVYQEFVKLYRSGTTMSTPSDALAKAQTRKLLGDPPTSPNKYTLGDEVIWETLLSLCPGDLIIVSRDRTFLDNENLLRSEFNIQGTRRLVAVTKHLSEALKQVGKPSKPIEKAERDRIQIEAEMRKAINTGKCPRCDVEMDEHGYEGDDGDSAWWLICPKCNFEVYPLPEPPDSSEE